MQGQDSGPHGLCTVSVLWLAMVLVQVLRQTLLLTSSTYPRTYRVVESLHQLHGVSAGGQQRRTQRAHVGRRTATLPCSNTTAVVITSATPHRSAMAVVS